MADIIPFKGLLYDPVKVGDIQKVMAPPYDVISPKMQDELYKRHPRNIVRIILAKTSPDGPSDERYKNSAEDLRKWLSEGIFIKDEKPAIYYYTQKYKLKNGEEHARKGFIALSKLAEFGGKGGIHPHEKTLSGPKADRLKLMQACEANLSCIFSLYSDPKLSLNKALKDSTHGTAPIIDVTDDEGIENKLWRVDDPEVIKVLIEAMKNKSIFIADGHHRYETALNYRNMMRERFPNFTGNEPYNYVMMYFSNMYDEGMTIWPTHRVIHSLPDLDARKFIDECSKYFDLESFSFESQPETKVRKEFLAKLESAGSIRTAIGLQIRGTKAYYLMNLKSKDVMDKVFGDKIPEVFKNLDVTVLHSLVLSKILGITQEAQERQTNIIYVKSHDEALNSVKKDANQLVFLLNPTKIEQVKAVAEAGFVMPQKSTYFYPKLLSGLVINLLGGKNIEARAVKV